MAACQPASESGDDGTSSSEEDEPASDQQANPLVSQLNSLLTYDAGNP